MLPRFKAIDNETGVMLRVLSIDLEFDYIIGLPFEEEARDTFGELIIEKRYYFEDIELLQSTGLFDGREIFEGDIVDVRTLEGTIYLRGIVKKVKGGFYIEGLYHSKIIPLTDFYFKSYTNTLEIEILGNKFEHPHLLGEE